MMFLYRLQITMLICTILTLKYGMVFFYISEDHFEFKTCKKKNASGNSVYSNTNYTFLVFSTCLVLLLVLPVAIIPGNTKLVH
jgi:hypothetical protein